MSSPRDADDEREDATWDEREDAPWNEREDATWQRLDKWLWCARFMKARSDCAALVRTGLVRINRQPTDKPHARLRPGDVLTLPWRDEIRVLRVLSLAGRRGPAPEARSLYEDVLATRSPASAATSDCA